MKLLEAGGHVLNRNREPGDHLAVGGVVTDGVTGGHDKSSER